LDDRITLWRNALHLFYESRKPPYVGPFKQAGLSKIVIDRPFMTIDSKETYPDIVSSGEDGWVVIEITTRPSSKESQLNSYALINPKNLGLYGLHPHATGPDVICARLDPVIDGPYCQLILRNRLQFKNGTCITNLKLREALTKANGNLDLHRLPNISIVIVPEMASKGKELRRGIFDIVIQLFDTNCEGKTIERIVKEGLDKIESCISPKDRGSLELSVKTQMDILIKDHLSEYIEFDKTSGIYRAKNKTDLHPNTRGFIVRELKKWAGGDRNLDEFSEEGPV
jgi:hypothetical protein